MLLVVEVESSSSASSTTTSPTSTPTTATTTTRSLPRSHNGRITSANHRSSSSSTSQQQQQQQRNNEQHEQRNNNPFHDHQHHYPPWNPSHKISRDGFLQDYYRRIPGEWEKEIRLNTIHRLESASSASSSASTTASRYAATWRNDDNNNNNDDDDDGKNGFWCQIRQVPGDGNCLFHSISLCLHHATNNGAHWNLDRSSNNNNNNNNKKSSSSSSPPSSISGGGGDDDDIDSDSDGSSRSRKNGKNCNFASLQDLYAHSQKLRHDAVACLRQGHRRLVLQGSERLACRELVQAAAAQYGLSSDEYCECMAQDSVWGGGPEIVALCNILQRPIHVYELAVVVVEEDEPQEEEPENYNTKKKRKANSNNAAILASSTSRGNDLLHSVLPSSSSSSSSQQQPCFVLRRMACFGSPRFDRKQPLHILSADSRFPDLEPGQQLAAGNHFLAVFPIVDRSNTVNNVDKRRKRIRGGARRSKKQPKNTDDVDGESNMDDEDSDCHSHAQGPWRWLNLWRRFL
jgi:OTU-like cysteine protease